MREDDGPDWLVFYLPMGGLEAAFPVGSYPIHAPNLGPRHRTWCEPLDNWLADLGRAVFAAVGFRLAIIGHEVSGTEYADMLNVNGIPDDRAIGYLRPEQGKLAYYGTNRWL